MRIIIKITDEEKEKAVIDSIIAVTNLDKSMKLVESYFSMGKFIFSNEENEEYDDFANRTCENCKYWGYFDSDVLFETCNFGNIEHSYRADSFLCNRWEFKNDN